jgi:4-methyl-5(b-hydroxyethyl)-thiazole monophosphate biosynthesis
MRRVLFLLADGFEELEFVAPYDILHRGGVEVKTSSISHEKTVTGSHGLPVLVNSLLNEIEGLPFDMLILPGGPGTKHLRESSAVKNMVIAANNAGKFVAAICAAPTVLANAGILRNHVATSFPSVKGDIEPHCKKHLDVHVVVSENIITSKGAGTAAEFGFCLLSLLAGAEKAAEIKRLMQF